MEKRGSVFTQCTEEEIEYFKAFVGDEVTGDEAEEKEAPEADVQQDEIKVVSVDAVELISESIK